MDACQACRWWGWVSEAERPDVPRDVPPDWRVCGRVGSYEHPPARPVRAATSSADPYCEAYLWTAPAFGCQQFAAREEPC